MLFLYVFLLFLLGAAFFTWIMVLHPLGEYRRFAGARSVVCPDSGKRVNVEVDREYVFRTTLRGLEHIELQSCSHWPERAGCDQDCLAQIDATPTYLNRVLAKWYGGKKCLTCHRALTAEDWQRGRLGLVGTHQTLVEIQQLPTHELPNVLQGYQPLCWLCHQAECQRRAIAPQLYKGDRRLKQKSLAEQFAE